MAEESGGLATEKRSWKPTKLPATTVNSLVSITHLNTEEGGGGGGDAQRVIQMDRFNRCLSVILGSARRETEVAVRAGGNCVVQPAHKEEEERERDRRKKYKLKTRAV